MQNYINIFFLDKASISLVTVQQWDSDASPGFQAKGLSHVSLPSRLSCPSVGGWESAVCTGLGDSLRVGLGLEVLLSTFGWYASDKELWLLVSSVRK